MTLSASIRKIYTLEARDFRLKLGKKTSIMGVINVTPDSFSRDGLLNHSPAAILKEAKKMVDGGADILDIGGESTRPGARKISAREESRRVIPVLNALSKKIRVPISIDTYKTDVAKAALDAGASIVNNIMGSKPNRSFLKMVKNYGAAIVLMHIKGTPRTMQKNVRYRSLIGEINASLKKSIEICLDCSINSDRIIIDPGIGFGKTVEHNCQIIKHLDRLNRLKKPILIGTSRKSFIGKTLNRDVENRRMGTAATVAAGIINGAHIIRVHDVREMADVARMTDAIVWGKSDKL